MAEAARRCRTQSAQYVRSGSTTAGKVDKVLPDQYAAIIDEAHKNNVRVTAHIATSSTARPYPAGLDASPIASATDIDDEMLAL